MKILHFIDVALIARLSRCDVIPFLDIAHAFIPPSYAELTPLPSENVSVSELNPYGVFNKRQNRCALSGYSPCVDQSRCCPNGWYCMDDGGGCCPNGQIRCGKNGCYDPKKYTCCTNADKAGVCLSPNTCCGDGCYNPNSERCCTGGSCPSEETCCNKQCCRSIGYCAADGFCSLCPAATQTVTRTSDLILSTTTTRTRTEYTEPEEATGFTCLPLTVTNDEGATLELDTECGLQYTPPETTSESGAQARNAPITPVPQLRPRQTSCTPYMTSTKTLTSTRTMTSRFIETTTVFVEQAGFSCPPMSVTNAVGDELSLDEKCQLEFSPAESNSSSTTSSSVIRSITQGSIPQTAGQPAGNKPKRAAAPWIMAAIIAILENMAQRF